MDEKPKAPREPKKVAAAKDDGGREVSEEQYETIPVSKRKGLIVRAIVGWDVDDEEKKAYFYIKYMGTGDKVYAVDAASFFKQNKAVYKKYKPSHPDTAWEELFKWEKIAQKYLSETKDSDGDPIIDTIGQYVSAPPEPSAA